MRNEYLTHKKNVFLKNQVLTYFNGRLEKMKITVEKEFAHIVREVVALVW
jgi:hypothetical protein